MTPGRLLLQLGCCLVLAVASLATRSHGRPASAPEGAVVTLTGKQRRTGWQHQLF